MQQDRFEATDSTLGASRCIKTFLQAWDKISSLQLRVQTCAPKQNTCNDEWKLFTPQTRVQNIDVPTLPPSDLAVTLGRSFCIHCSGNFDLHGDFLAFWIMYTLYSSKGHNSYSHGWMWWSVQWAHWWNVSFCVMSSCQSLVQTTWLRFRNHLSPTCNHWMECINISFVFWNNIITTPTYSPDQNMPTMQVIGMWMMKSNIPVNLIEEDLIQKPHTSLVRLKPNSYIRLCCERKVTAAYILKHKTWHEHKW